MQEQGSYAVRATVTFRFIRDEKIKALLHGKIQLAGKMGM